MSYGTMLYCFEENLYVRKHDTAAVLYIDNMRVLLISLTDLFHLAITYGASGDWYYYEITPDDIAVLSILLYGLFNATVKAFALGLFFMALDYLTPHRSTGKAPGGF